MAIDIDRLSEAQLIDLNHRIVARLKLIQQLRAHTDMLDFRIGERVTFEPDDRPPVTGIIAKYNRKTVSIVTEDGNRWNVSPGFLTRAPYAAVAERSTKRSSGTLIEAEPGAASAPSRGTNVIEMPRRDPGKGGTRPPKR